MTQQATLSPTNALGALDQKARWAGFFYMIVVLTGTFSLGLAPGQIFTGDTPDALARAVFDQRDLLSAAIIAEATCYVGFACLALALLGLLGPVHQGAAAGMAMLVLVSVALGFSNLTSMIEIHRLSETGDVAMSAEAVAGAYERYRAGIFLQSVLWGAWLLPLGYLTVCSGFLPRLLGLGLILAGMGYLAHFTARLLMEGYRDSAWPELFAAPRIAEILMAIWLLVLGARRSLWGKRPPWPAPDQSRGLS